MLINTLKKTLCVYCMVNSAFCQSTLFVGTTKISQKWCLVATNAVHIDICKINLWWPSSSPSSNNANGISAGMKTNSRDFATELEIRSSIADIRDALKHGPVTPNIWGFYSNKNHQLLTLLGDVTFIQAVLLEGDPKVCSYAVGTCGASEEESHLFGRDLIVEFQDRSKHWYLCGRYNSLVRAPKPHLRKQIADTAKIAASAGAQFQIKTERDLADRMPEFRNWLTLCSAMTRARDFSLESARSSFMKLLTQNTRTSVQSILNISGYDPAVMLAAIARALANGEIYSDLITKPLSVETQLSSASETHRSITSCSATANIEKPELQAVLLPFNRRTACVPELWRDLAKWPKPDPNRIQDAKTYRNNKIAIEMYLAGRIFDSIFRETRIKVDWVRALIRKCITIHPDGQIVGFRGAVRYGFRTGYTRHAPLPESNIHEARKSGYAGAFVQLLQRFPDELMEIVEAYVLKIRKDNINQLPEARITWVKLKENIHGFLKERGVKDGEYPFNVRDQAYSSIAELGRSMLFKNPNRFINVRMGREAGRRSTIGKGIQPLIQANGPFQIVELDFHKHDAAAIVEVNTPNGSCIACPVPRTWIGCIVDTFNWGVIGLSDSFESQTTENCVLDLIDSAINPPELDAPSHSGCQEKEGWWLPGQLLSDFQFHGWDILRLDRAWAHQSTGVLSKLIATIGCAVCFSRPKCWWAREVVERSFEEITRRGAQRLPNTYGTGPTDPSRNKPEEVAISIKFHQDELCSLSRKIVREINSRSREGPFWESPINSLHRTKAMATYFPRPLPVACRSDRPTQWVTLLVRVEGNVNKGEPPSVRTNRCRFLGPQLASSWGLIGKNVYLEVSRRDIRTAHLVSAQHHDVIGAVKPEKKWMLHGLGWRNFLMIQKFGRIQAAHETSDDPAVACLEEKAKQLLDNKAKQSPRSRKVAAQQHQNLKRDLIEGKECTDQEGQVPEEREDSNAQVKTFENEKEKHSIEFLLSTPPMIRSYSR